MTCIRKAAGHNDVDPQTYWTAASPWKPSHPVVYCAGCYAALLAMGADLHQRTDPGRSSKDETHRRTWRPEWLRRGVPKNLTGWTRP